MNTTTCSSICQDSDSWMCRSTSTFCKSGIFTSGAYCNTGAGHSPCEDGFYCVYDAYTSGGPYLCMKYNNP
ncbi:hypothetical protein I4U23_016704 [Adineta vaga]|nr:hypothetical protein I4U23_016704 [Adineta vaga]